MEAEQRTTAKGFVALQLEMIVWDLRLPRLQQVPEDRSAIASDGGSIPPGSTRVRMPGVRSLMGPTGFDGAARPRSTIREATAVSRAPKVNANDGFYLKQA